MFRKVFRKIKYLICQGQARVEVCGTSSYIQKHIPTHFIIIVLHHFQHLKTISHLQNEEKRVEGNIRESIVIHIFCKQ